VISSWAPADRREEAAYRAGLAGAMRRSPWSVRLPERGRFLPVEEAARAMRVEPEAVLRLAAGGYLHARADPAGAYVEVEPAVITGPGAAAAVAAARAGLEGADGPGGPPGAPDDPAAAGGAPASPRAPHGEAGGRRGPARRRAP
jgi:hypothetical protein